MWYLLTPDKQVIPAPEGWKPTDEWWLNERQVADTRLFLDVRISTVFLGLDHNHFGKGPPIVFETMIFGGKFDQTTWRYSTWEEAVQGHQHAVKYAYCQFTGEDPDGLTGTDETQTPSEGRSAVSHPAYLYGKGPSEG